MLTLSEFIKEAARVRTKQEKAEVIRKYCAVPWIKEAVKFCYDPFMQFYMKKLPPLEGMSGIAATTGGTVTKHDLDEEMWGQVKYILLNMHNRAVSKAEANDCISICLAGMTPAGQDALRRIILKDLRVQIGAKSINDALGEELIPVPDTQLCKTYDPELSLQRVEYWWGSRKLNGLRGRWVKRDGQFHLLSREDYPLVGFTEIEKELQQIQERHDLTMIDGEIFSFDVPFQTIMSIARGEKNYDPDRKQLLKFHAFNVQKKEPWSCTAAMISALQNIFRDGQYKYVTPLAYQMVDNNPEAITKACKQFMDEGYEGIVLRDPEISWEAGKRNNHLLKYKLFYETDLTVKEVLYGKEGKKWENSVAALLCEGTARAMKVHVGQHEIWRPIAADEEPGDGIEVRDIPIRVEASCSTLTDDERAAMTAAGKELLVGMTAEVVFQTFTDKPDAEGWYSLQFPTFSKFKNLD